MNRKYRITSSAEFKRVRGEGKTTAHPLVVLVTMDGNAENARAGIITSKAIGGAVQRNRVRRRLRAALASLLPKVTKNVDILVIARKPMLDARFIEITSAVTELLVRAKCLEENDNPRRSG